jgi:hypothetical protein
MKVSSMLPHWMPTQNQIAQCSHFFIAVSIVLLARLCGFHWLVQAGLVLAWALPKEFVFDLIVEQDSFADSREDFLWYCIGGAVAVGLLLLTGL